MDDIREKAHQLCRDYIGGVWKIVHPDDIIIERLGGFVHLVVKLSLPTHFCSLNSEPTQILMKNFSKFFEVEPYRRMIDNIITIYVAEEGLSPKVYGIFEDGRLDEFLPSRDLRAKDFHDPVVISAIAKKIARLHSLDLPIEKNTRYFDYFFPKIIEMVVNDDRNLNSPRRQEILSKFLAINPREEMNWLNKMRDKNCSPIVFCHGDYQVTNILLCNDPKRDLIYFIDFDIGGYNTRGFDIASLFRNFCMDFFPDPPYFKADLTQFPSLDEQKSFFEIYLKEFQKCTNSVITDIGKEIDQLLEEYKVYVLLIHVVAICFGFIKVPDKENEVDWMYFSEEVLKLYIAQKKIFFEANDDKKNKLI